MILFKYQEMDPEVLQFELNIKGRGTANSVSILLAVETTMEDIRRLMCVRVGTSFSVLISINNVECELTDDAGIRALFYTIWGNEPKAVRDGHIKITNARLKFASSR